ncbi:MAG TPA: rhomboid family intramembrane serine protease [Jatrophihabitantaceae bacterium]|jgi:membrane associated rhomboid family serine protease|nr:rhomboid family intramembrane serine protease [Jatrophihabitantaceae bacterium]
MSTTSDPAAGQNAELPRCYRHPNREAHVRCTRCDRPICPECMRAASVGFHCPDDAKMGSRSQRPLRNTMGAVLRESPPYLTIALIVLNVAAYLATALPSPRGLNHPEYTRLFQDWQLQPIAVYHDDTYYRLLTAAFLHANLLHIAVNMVSLAFVGPYLERSLGVWRYLSLYLLAALGGSAAIYAFGSPLVPVIGASGALFGLLGACLVLVRRLNLDLQWILMIIVLNFTFTFSVAGISRLGHIGGFVTGALAGLAMGGLPSMRQRLPDRVQLAGLLGLLGLIAVVVVAATAIGDF